MTAVTIYHGLEYDYLNRAWLEDGKYLDCGHYENVELELRCDCYGRQHIGEVAIRHDQIH